MKKNKNTKIVIGIIVVLAVIVGAMYLGVIPDVANIQTSVNNQNNQNALPESTCNVNLDLSDTEKFTILETFFDKDLNYAVITPYIHSLNMEAYGCNNMNAQTLLEQFEAEYAIDGWASYTIVPEFRSDWVGYHEVWTRGSDARSVSVAEGAAVTAVFPGYATVYLVAHGPMTTYIQFWEEVN
jgi:hypothetical protein